MSVSLRDISYLNAAVYVKERVKLSKMSINGIITTKKNNLHWSATKKEAHDVILVMLVVIMLSVIVTKVMNNNYQGSYFSMKKTIS